MGDVNKARILESIAGILYLWAFILDWEVALICLIGAIFQMVNQYYRKRIKLWEG